MKRGLLVGIVAAACFWITARTSQAQDQLEPEHETIELEIRATLSKMRSAAEGLDAATLYTYVLDTRTPPIIEDGRLMPTHEAARASTAEGLRGLSRLAYVYDAESVTVLGPDASLWVASGIAHATLPDGRDLSVPFAETIVLVKTDGIWKVLHAHRSGPG